MFWSLTLRRRGIEFGDDFRQSLGRLVGILVQDRDKLALVDDGDALDLLGGGGVHLLELGAMGRRAQELRIEHPRQADVAGILGLAGDLVHARPGG